MLQRYPGRLTYNLISIFFPAPYVECIYAEVYIRAAKKADIEKGELLILILLKPFKDKPFRMFVGTFALCGVLEYSAAWFLETLLHKSWWDYHGYFLNLQGRICLEGLLVFGLAGVGFTYLLAPFLDEVYQKLRPAVRRNLRVALLILFGIDAVYSAGHPNCGEEIVEECSTNFNAFNIN